MPSPTFGVMGTALAGSGHIDSNIPVPASVANNSLVLVFLYIESDTAVTPATNFTQKALAENNTAANEHRLYLFWKRATGADSGTYTFAHANSWSSGVAMRVDGAITTGDPFDTSTGAPTTGVGATSVTAAPSLSLTTTVADTLLVYAASNFNGGATYTPPTGFTERIDQEEFGVNTLAKGAAGATGSLSATASAAGIQSAILGAILSTAAGAAALAAQARRANAAVMRAATR